MRRVMVALLVIGAAMPAVARDRTGFKAIASGDMAGAERVLLAERRIYPDRPELMLNLAAVYARTGRATDARDLYRAVLDQPTVVLDTPSGATASSHTLATSALTRLDGVRVATR